MSDHPPRRYLAEIHRLQAKLTSSPWSHDTLELAIAAATSLPISARDDSAALWLLVVAAPSADKTGTILLLKGVDRVRFLDTLTENALASGYAPQQGQPRHPDLLQLIAQAGDQCLIIKDLTTLFSLRDDKVKKILGELQSIYDGEYVKATGTVGLLKYTTRFALVACITPLALSGHHRYMSTIGGRFLSYRVPRLTDDERDAGFDVTWETQNRKGTLGQLRQLVADLVECLLESGVELEPETHDERHAFNRLADLLAHGRAVISWRKTQFEKWEIDQVQTEEPFRALQQLRNLGRALARLHDGRTRMTEHEFELLRRVVLSSMPMDRTEVLALLPEQPEGLTVESCAMGIGKSKDRAAQLLDELRRAGLLVQGPGDSEGGRPAARYQPAPKFAALLGKPVEPLDHLADLDGDFSDKSPPRHTGEEEKEDTQGGVYAEKSPDHEVGGQTGDIDEDAPDAA